MQMPKKRTQTGVAKGSLQNVAFSGLRLVADLRRPRSAVKRR